MTNIKAVRPVGKDQTYDLEVNHTDHQYYLSNGMLTSNSHSVLYSMTSALTAHLKSNYPVEFLIANLMSEVNSNAKASKDNILKIKTELRNKNVKIVPPHVNKSGLSWKIIDDHTVMTGLDSLKYMGKDAIPEIISKRPFTSYKDLIYRTDASKVRSPSIQAMAASGSLDDFKMDRKTMFHYASDFRAKLRNHIAKLERICAKEWAQEQGYTKVKDENGEYWMDAMGNQHESPQPSQERLNLHLEEFNYPFPEEKSWTIQELFALEDFYMGEGLSGDTFDRYPSFFDRKKSIPFEALKQMFPWQRINDDERLNRKANTHYLGNHKIRPLEAVVTSVFSFTVKKEDSPIFGQEMARLTIQDAWGYESGLLCFPEAWDGMKNRIEKELSGGAQSIEPGIAIRFLGSFQWENENSTSFVLSDILDFKPPPSLPTDRSSKKVKMPRSKTKTKDIKCLDHEDMLFVLEDEMLGDGISTVDSDDIEPIG
jgi:DNA polymerase III alpha subunit